MPIPDPVQHLGLLLGWYVAVGLDVGGLLRHLGRLAYRQQVLEAMLLPELRYEAKAQRDNEIFRSETKGFMALWAILAIAQRSVLDWAEPVGVWPWALWGTHVAMLSMLMIWSSRDR